MAFPLLFPVPELAIKSIPSPFPALKSPLPRPLQSRRPVSLSKEPTQWRSLSRSELDNTLAFREATEKDGSPVLQIMGSQQPVSMPACDPIWNYPHVKLGTVRPLVRTKIEANAGHVETDSFSSGIWKEGITEIQQQEFLWQNLFSDSTQWWDNRRAKRTSRHPDFRHKRLREPLWVDHRLKPAWVDSKLAEWDADQAARVSWPLDSTSGGRAFVPSTEISAVPDPVSDSSKEVTCKWQGFFGLFEMGQLTDALDVLDSLQKQGSHADTDLFYRILKKCFAYKDLTVGKRVHTLIHGSGYASNSFLANHIICMYASHGKLDEAMQVFRDVAAPNTFMWASIIKACAELGQSLQGVELYRQMKDADVRPDNHVFAVVLKACANTADVGFGKEVHADIMRSAIEPDIVVGIALVDMYSKCGSLVEAREVFDGLPHKNVVTWTAMIGGYCQHKLGQNALALYAMMQDEGIMLPNEVTYLCLLQACAQVGAVHQGKQLHTQIKHRGLEHDEGLVVGLVDMYSKCGNLDEARRMLDKVSGNNVVSWNALLNGYAEHGYSLMAIQCFKDMVQKGVKPDAATFACLLVGCSHKGLVDEGRHFFNMMAKEHGIIPEIRHHTCMVDLLGRSGYLDEAENMLQTMPFEDDGVGWTALLSACKTHGDMARGKRCFDRLVRLDPQCSTAYVLLANIYASAGMWSDVDTIENMRKAAGAWKKPARSCIEVKNNVHEFIVGEAKGEVPSKVRSMNLRWKEDGGHVPHTELVLEAVPDMTKEDALCGHAEKLALAYGLLNTPDGETLLVTKNLRMCNDCHSGTTIMSRLEKREIIVRDSHRVHHFVNGFCSCGNRH